MAGNNTGNRGRSNSASRASSKGRPAGKRNSKKKKKGNQDSIRFFFVLLVATVLVFIIIIMQPKEEEGVTGIGIHSEMPTEGSNDVSQISVDEIPENKVTQQPEATTIPGKSDEPAMTIPPIASMTPEPTKSATPTPTLQPLQMNVNLEQAFQKVINAVDTSIYKIELFDENLYLSGREYFQFLISESGREIEPFLIVDKEAGNIYCYSSEGIITEFVRFPLEAGAVSENSGEPQTELTVEQAYEVLCSYSKEQLGLAKEAREYDAEFDDNLTLVKGVSCYRVDFTEVSGGKVRNRGEFYISVDGTQCFTIDRETNEFVPVDKE